MKLNYQKLALSLATLTLLTACNQKPKNDTAIGDNKNTAVSSVTATSTTTTTTITATTSSVAPTSAISEVTTTVAPVVPASSSIMTTAPSSSSASTATKAKVTTTIPPEKAGLAKDLIAFNNAINDASLKSQKLQADFIQKHKNDKSPDVQVLFIKEGIKSLDQQKSALQAVKLTDPKAIAMRDKFISAIEQQKSAYTFMVKTPKPTQAQQEDVAKKMQNVQKTGEDAQQTFLKLAQEAGLEPAGNQ